LPREHAAEPQTYPGLPRRLAPAFRNIHVDIDRSKANKLGISMRLIGDTLALLVGEHYVNRFNRVGRSYEMIQQVPLTPETLTRNYVNSAAGQPVPLSNLVTLKTATEPNAV
jgi:multidrug efflux pump